MMHSDIENGLSKFGTFGIFHSGWNSSNTQLSNFSIWKKWRLLKFTVNLRSASVMIFAFSLPYVIGSTSSKSTEFRSKTIRDREERHWVILMPQSWNDCLKFGSLHCECWVRTYTFQESQSGSTWPNLLVFNVVISNESHTCSRRSFGGNEPTAQKRFSRSWKHSHTLVSAILL
jgi:hypothetical protein